MPALRCRGPTVGPGVPTHSLTGDCECAFVRLRQMLAQHADLARKLDVLEKKYDAQFKVVFDAIHELMTPPDPKRRRIGFRAGDNG